jgi:outer membrane protein TolC
MGLTEGDIPSTVRFSEMPSADGEMLSDIKTYLDAALANRPDLKAYREQYESAKYGYYSSSAAFGPTLSFNLGLGYTDTHTRNHRSNNSSRSDNFNVNYGLSANWDIFSGGRTYLAMRAAEANMVATEFTVAAAWINVIQEVRVAYDNYITGLKQVKLNQKNVEIVRKMRDLVNEEYKAGSAGITRLNEAQYDLVNAETALANAVINMHNAKAQLKAATDAN